MQILVHYFCAIAAVGMFLYSGYALMSKDGPVRIDGIFIFLVFGIFAALLWTNLRPARSDDADSAKDTIDISRWSKTGKKKA